MAARKKASSRKYGEAANKSVERALHKEKASTLKSGAGRHPKVKTREQAIAIGLSEARAKGAKVPPKKTGAKKSSAKKTSRKRAAKK
jgi:hypothetical protein